MYNRSTVLYLTRLVLNYYKKYCGGKIKKITSCWNASNILWTCVILNFLFWIYRVFFASLVSKLWKEICFFLYKICTYISECFIKCAILCTVPNNTCINPLETQLIHQSNKSNHYAELCLSPTCRTKCQTIFLILVVKIWVCLVCVLFN